MIRWLRLMLHFLKSNNYSKFKLSFQLKVMEKKQWKKRNNSKT